MALLIWFRQTFVHYNYRRYHFVHRLCSYGSPQSLQTTRHLLVDGWRAGQRYTTVYTTAGPPAVVVGHHVLRTAERLWRATTRSAWVFVPSASTTPSAVVGTRQQPAVSVDIGRRRRQRGWPGASAPVSYFSRPERCELYTSSILLLLLLISCVTCVGNRTVSACFESNPSAFSLSLLDDGRNTGFVIFLRSCYQSLWLTSKTECMRVTTETGTSISAKFYWGLNIFCWFLNRLNTNLSWTEIFRFWTFDTYLDVTS